jgi:predicted Zn-dependent peptidase
MGSVEDLKAASLDDVREFFATYYVPENAVLTLVGDVDADTALHQIEEYFGGIPAGRTSPSLPEMGLPPTFGVREPAVVRDDVTASRLFFTSRIAPLGSLEHDSATLCAAVLGSGNGSRLHRGLVRERKIATSANAFTFDLAKGSDLLVVDVTGRPGVSLTELESATTAILDGLCVDPISDDELGRAVAMTTTELLTNMESCQHHADRLSQCATYFGDPYRAYTEAERLERVSETVLNSFVATRLGNDNRLSLAFVPRTEAA